MARESPLLKGIHFFGLGRGLSGAMACSERGLRLGSLHMSEIVYETQSRPTHIHSMEPPHRKRRAVSRIPLQAQAVPAVDHMVSASLCTKTSRSGILVFLLFLALCL